MQYDLRGARFITVRDMISLLSQASNLRREGVRVVVHAPTDPSVANYPARMGMGRYLDNLGVEHDLPVVRSHALADHQLLELQCFTASTDIEALGGLLLERLKENNRSNGLEPLVDTLAELADNVITHSGCGEGYVAAQVFNYGKSNERVTFAIGDGGVGIAATLAEGGYSPRDDHHAIRLAIQEHVSGVSDRRGVGLPTVLDAVRGLRGSVEIRSGSGVYRQGPHTHGRLDLSWQGRTVTVLSVVAPGRPGY